MKIKVAICRSERPCGVANQVTFNRNSSRRHRSSPFLTARPFCHIYPSILHIRSSATDPQESLDNMQSRTSNFNKLRRRQFSSHAATAAGSAGPAISPHAAQPSSSHSQDRELQLVQNISNRLETGLNEHALKAIMELLERGEHPDAIVAAVTSLSQRAAASGG